MSTEAAGTVALVIRDLSIALDALDEMDRQLAARDVLLLAHGMTAGPHESIRLMGYSLDEIKRACDAYELKGVATFTPISPPADPTPD